MAKKIEAIVRHHPLAGLTTQETQERTIKLLDVSARMNAADWILRSLSEPTTSLPRKDLDAEDSMLFGHWYHLFHEHSQHPEDPRYEPGYTQARSELFYFLGERAATEFYTLEQARLRDPQTAFLTPSLRQLCLQVLSDDADMARADLSYSEQEILTRIYRYSTESSFRRSFFPKMSDGSEARFEDIREKSLVGEMEANLWYALSADPGVESDRDDVLLTREDLTLPELLIFELIRLHQMGLYGRRELGDIAGLEAQLEAAIVEEGQPAGVPSEVGNYQLLLEKLLEPQSRPKKQE